MALEPLNSVMTFQAQDTVKPKVQSVQPADMEVSPADQTVRVDATTASVVKTQSEDEEADLRNHIECLFRREFLDNFLRVLVHDFNHDSVRVFVDTGRRRSERRKQQR